MGETPKAACGNACKATYNTVVHFIAALLSRPTSNAELMTGTFALGHTS